MRPSSFGVPFALALTLTLGLCACDSKDISDHGFASLDDFLPELPPATNGARETYAGQVADTSELIPGPASQGIIGDYFIRNDRARFVIQAPGSLVGVVPSGGNLIDAVPLRANGQDLAEDHFGETSIVYQLGRHCDHQSVEILRNGSEGGVAAIRVRGVTGYNEFVNIRGIGILPIQNELVPELPDFAECATTYVLEPGSATLQTYFTLFNAGSQKITGPMGMLSDTGGEVAVFQPKNGFTRVGEIAQALDANTLSTPYMVYQGPQVAYGIMPRHPVANTPNSSVVVLGVSVFFFGLDSFLNALESTKNKFFSIQPGEGTTFQVDTFVGQNAAQVDAEYQRLYGGATQKIAGSVTWDDGTPAAGARVGIFEDSNGDKEIDSKDKIIAYVDADENGTFAGALRPGGYLLRAEVLNVARSEASGLVEQAGVGTANLVLQRPVAYDFRIVDIDSGNALIPGRITVIGEHPVPIDSRVQGAYDTFDGIVTTVIATRGTSTGVGDGVDGQILLPPGQDYRIFVSRGTEWSVVSKLVSPTAGDTPDELEFRMRRLVDTSGYIASEYHVHSLGSPDSPVPDERRVATAVADGIELYATADHDFVSAHQPIIKALGLTRLVRSIIGEEISPLVYGHFIAWPIDRDPNSPNGGAVDWPFGDNGFAMLPKEIFSAARERGAEMVQVNHPRSTSESPSDTIQHFDRMGLYFDYERRIFEGDANLMTVPAEWLRLPNEPLFDDSFNSLEIWNGFGAADTNVDGRRELTKLDTVMRDWFNFMSFGKNVTPTGSSDTHYEVLESMGMPRTLVRVSDDSAAAIEEEPMAGEANNDLVREVLDNLTHASGAFTDVIITDGPHLSLTVGSDDRPLGKVHDGQSGSIELTIEAQSADWAQIDTIEVFANNTPEIGSKALLQPIACFTSLSSLEDFDPCAMAGIGGAGTLIVNSVDLGSGFSRFEASKTLTIRPTDIPLRAGGTGSDAWIVVRVSGQRPIYPLFVGELVGENTSIFVEGNEAEVEAAIKGLGRPATALSSAFYVDFDGGGYLAPFTP